MQVAKYASLIYEKWNKNGNGVIKILDTSGLAFNFKDNAHGHRLIVHTHFIWWDNLLINYSYMIILTL